MKTIKVAGKRNQHKVMLYALSTCVWCKRTKKFLLDNEVEYEYVDVDTCSREDVSKIRDEIASRGGEVVYPATIIDNQTLIKGYDLESLRKALEL